jgi:hypothetical protein
MFYNHSDDKPNIKKNGNLKENTMEIVALEDIPAHTELVSTYYSKKWRECFQKF